MEIKEIKEIIVIDIGYEMENEGWVLNGVCIPVYGCIMRG